MSGKQRNNQLSNEDKEIQILEEKRKREMATYIGNNIRKYRVDMKLTREQLAEKSHITASHLYQLEIGNCVPSIITTVDICNALNISVAQLTNSLLFNNVSKFTEIIANDFDKLSDDNKDMIIHLIKYLENK